MIFDVKYKPLLQGGLRPERWRGVHTPPLPQLYRTQAGWGALFIISACWRGLRFYITILGIFLAQTFEKATVAVKSWVFFYKKCWQFEVWNCAQFSLSSFPEDRIDHDSPLYSFGPEDLKTKRIEIVIWLSGTRSKTGTAISGTASYTSDEIVWGGRSVVPVVL